MRRLRLAAPLGIACACLVSACAGLDASGSAGEGDTSTLTVLAAASLTDAFGPIIEDFEEQQGVLVEASFAGSSTVVQQANEGAGADVVALAGEESLIPLEQDLRIGPITVFATNALTIAVPADNPAGIADLDDLAEDGVRLVVCAEQVPCGSAAQALFEQEGLSPSIASFENDVRATLTKVELGEADAGLVYRTDVAAAQARGGPVTGIDIASERTILNRYPVITVSDNELGQAFVDHLLSDPVQAQLVEAGFGAAP